MSTNTGLCPHHRDIQDTGLTDERFGRIMCPNLRTGVRMSLINPNEEGWVAIEELREYLDYIGVPRDSKVADLLIITAVNAGQVKKEGFVNITELQDSFLDHGSDSGILNTPKGFDEERLQHVLAFANNGRITKQDLSKAISAFYQNGVNGKSVLGTNILSFEMAGMINVYGRTDPQTGEKYFTEQDFIDLWKNNRFPKDWQAPKTPFYNTFAALTAYLAMLWTRVRTGWGTKGP